MKYNIAEIRKFLMERFNDDELGDLCLSHFDAVFNDFTAGMSKRQKIRSLLTNCKDHDLFPQLQAAIEADFHDKYQFFPIPLPTKQGSQEQGEAHKLSWVQLALRLLLFLSAVLLSAALWNSCRPKEPDATQETVLPGQTPESTVEPTFATTLTNTATSVATITPPNFKPTPRATWADTATNTATATASPATRTPTITSTPTHTPSATWTPSHTPSAIPTSTDTPTVMPDPNSPPANAVPGATWIRPKDNMVMVYVEGGAFQMGSSEAEKDIALAHCEQIDVCERSWFVDESPQHSVTLDSFWIDKTEVTNEQYTRCTEVEPDAEACALPYDADECNWSKYSGDAQPVVCVTWYDASKYCTWVGGGLPTEAQWEYAARGPDGRIYPWGNEPPGCDRTNIGECDNSIREVVSYLTNGDSWVGAAEMAGNVAEWVNDWYSSNYDNTSPTDNPTGPATGGLKVLRGGRWDYNLPDLSRAASRDHQDPAAHFENTGFRCVMSPGS